jgi:hypothetical protein
MYAKSLSLALMHIVFMLSFFYQSTQAQWKKTGGPSGIDLNVFYQRGNTLFAGSSANGAFKSINNGISWSAANSGIADKSVFSFIADANFLFAGTDSGVFRSSNNGVTWQAVNNGIQQKFVYSFVFANGFLFAGTSSGLYKSSNQGASWSDANGNALNSSIIHDIIFTSPDLVVIADNLIFYSDDNGNSWNYNPQSPFVLGATPSFLALHDSVLLATASQVFRSFDGGINWSNAINATAGSNIVGLVQASTFTVAGTKEGMFFSSNFGRTWKPVTTHSIRNGNWFVNDFYRSGKNFLLAYNEIGVGYSADSGRNWNYTLQGFPPAASIDNALDFSNNILLTGTHGDGVYKSTNAGNTWIKTGTTNNLDTLSNSNIFALLKVNNIILAGTCGNGLYRSADNGVSWTHITNGLPKQSNGSLCVQSLVNTTNAFLIATDQGLFFSRDSGITWNASNLTGKDVVAVVANDSVACAAVENFTGFNTIYRSVNDPASWSVVFQSGIDDWTSMASDGKNHFYTGTLSTSNYVSNNDGISWQTVGPGIPVGSGGYAIGVLNKNVFIGNNNGVYFSNNNGTSFTEASTGFDKHHSVQGFTFSSTDIYAGLFENSIWKRPLSDFGITALQKSEDAQLPFTFIPNPLVSESKFSYTLSSMQQVIINLYNANGNLVKNIKDVVEIAGNHSVTIRKESLHAGNYFLSVLAGNKHAVVNIVVE